MNILLTGNINTGKSTIIHNFLAKYTGKISGYKTVREKTHFDRFYGVYILDINDQQPKLNLHNKVGDCFEDKSLIPFENVFETLGVQLLSNYKDADIIIMDEIGVLERNCDLFKKKILECLDSKIDILGVIKQKDKPFLNSIRSRSDVVIIEINGKNNDDVLRYLKSIFH